MNKPKRFKTHTLIALLLLNVFHLGQAYSATAPKIRKMNAALGDIEKSYIGQRQRYFAESYGMARPVFHCFTGYETNEHPFDKHCDKAITISGRNVIVHANFIGASHNYLTWIIVLSMSRYYIQRKYHLLPDNAEFDHFAFDMAMKYWSERKDKTLDERAIESYIKEKSLDLEKMYSVYKRSKLQFYQDLSARKLELDPESFSIYDIDPYSLGSKAKRQLQNFKSVIDSIQ